MGKGIALMFKERFQENFRAYEAACKAGEVQIGRMFVTETGELGSLRWIIISYQETLEASIPARVD